MGRRLLFGLIFNCFLLQSTILPVIIIPSSFAIVSLSIIVPSTIIRIISGITIIVCIVSRIRHIIIIIRKCWRYLRRRYLWIILFPPIVIVSTLAVSIPVPASILLTRATCTGCWTMLMFAHHSKYSQQIKGKTYNTENLQK